MTKSSIFFYGSFMTGMVHHNKVAAFVKEVKPAKTLGALYRLPAGYPAMLDGTNPVKGELATLNNFKDIIKLLDEFEGFSPTNPEKSLYNRVEKEIEVEGGKKPVTAFVYVLNPSKLPKEATIVESGDFRAIMGQNPPLPTLLSESQKRYILKLGASSGRDIVPINLDIYRDLLNKGLIVDKGRRLALTNLGIEVYRFLA